MISWLLIFNLEKYHHISHPLNFDKHLKARKVSPIYDPMILYPYLSIWNLVG